MSETSTEQKSCEQLCAEHDVFFRQLPPVDEFDNEILKLRREVFSKRGISGPTIAIHVSALKETESQADIIKSFLDHGVLGKVGTRTITNFFNSYATEARPKDLVVAMVINKGDLEWKDMDSKGHKSGFPIIPYSKEATHIPPDRIVGFYFI